MTNVEIALLLVLIAYGAIFGIICAGLFSRIRRNKSSIEITRHIVDGHNSRIDRINNRIDFQMQMICDKLEEINKGDKVMEIKFKRCRFTATLDNGSTHKVFVKVPCESPHEYIWILAMRECEKFESPLHQLCWNETAIEGEYV